MELETVTDREYERVPFRLLRFVCCGYMACWVNPRFPNYCPECGKPALVEKPETLVLDETAILEVHHGV